MEVWDELGWFVIFKAVGFLDVHDVRLAERPEHYRHFVT